MPDLGKSRGRRPAVQLNWVHSEVAKQKSVGCIRSEFTIRSIIGNVKIKKSVVS